MFFPLVIDLDNCLTGAFDHCCIAGNTVDCHIFKGNSVFYCKFLFRSCLAFNHKVSKCFCCDLIFRKSKAFIYMLKHVSAIASLYVILYTICSIGILCPLCCIVQIFCPHCTDNFLIPSTEGITLNCHHRCKNLSAVFQFI